MATDPRAARAPFRPTPRTDLTTFTDPDQPVAGATAAEISGRRFGGPTRVESSPFTLTTTVQTVLPGNPRRVFWTIINRGSVNAAVDTDPSMTFADGILLGAAGGFVQSDVQEDGESVAWPVVGVCESGTCVVRILQVMRV